MIRLFLPDTLSPEARVVPSADQGRYLLNVMRLGAGDGLLAFNGRDGEWRMRVAETTKRGCVLEAVDRTREQTVGPDLELVAALVKRGRLETIVEKAAELGARRVRLAVTRRTNADHARVGRLQAIAVEAAEQTGRLDVPEVVEAEPLARMLDGWDASRRLLFCDEGGEAPPALAGLRAEGEGPWAVLIGPEGGFDPGERERLRAAPFVVTVGLGPRILRADTAAIAALALWQAALGDWR